MAQSFKRDPHSGCFSDGSLDGIIYTIDQLIAAEQQVRFQPAIVSCHTSDLGFEK
ncbi:hypothetical protein [Microcoleus sp. OTE_8_concoct_300]|uniref:hypothetical protein n=1 Tax=Microcoleus sp. OTE_8_concoct_300 TaxID=2964710 RepID=UPI00403F3358